MTPPNLETNATWPAPDTTGVDPGGFDPGGFDPGRFDPGGFDAGGFDPGGFDAGGFDAGGFDAGGFDPAGFAVEAGALWGGRYLLLEQVAFGGMGKIYRARDLELEEIIAIKVPHQRLLDRPEVLERLRWEVRLARRVGHPNVVRTFDIGEHQGLRFLTMEFIEGESLAARWRRRDRFSLAELLPIVDGITNGLAAAHAASIVHRDLKPGNVLLAWDGRVVLTDFGIACQTSDRRGPFQGWSTGTPAYMAPEQVAGLPVDGRADIYALGVMLYELLTGEGAWRGRSPIEQAMARLITPPPDPRRHRPDLPDRVAELVLGCLAIDRDERIGDARKVYEELWRAHHSADPVAAPPRRAPLDGLDHTQVGPGAPLRLGLGSHRFARRGEGLRPLAPLAAVSAAPTITAVTLGSGAKA